MGIKDVLGTISPAYGVVSGHGAFGELADSGIGGAIPLMLAERRQNKEAQKSQNEVKQVKKGGMVGSASKRADGCCVKGKTRGKIV